MKRKVSTAPKLNAAEQQAEDTRKRLRRAHAVAKDIKRLARAVQRENDAAQRALLELAHDVLERGGEDHIAEPGRVAANG